jgi:hypothetical protein
MVAALTGFGALVFVAFLLLLKYANARLKAAEARVDAAEMRADVQEALRHLDITSCGGHPCIRIDKRSPTWKSGTAEYVLADGASTPRKRL